MKKVSMGSLKYIKDLQSINTSISKVFKKYY